MRFVPLEKLINLAEGYRREFRIDYHRLLLLQLKGELHLIEAVCPHQEHPLVEAWLEGDTLVCPLHSYKFSLLTGNLLHYTEEPCRPLRVWPVVYEGADVGLMWDDGDA
jgi:nitrite reductase/ring-hydroxylating ferredoxin subunit